MGHDVFISYSSKDVTIADAVCAALEGSDVPCWIAPRDILPGREYGSEIVSAISQSKMMVLVFSAHSNDSQQVLREVERAVSRRIPIVPLRIDPTLPTGSFEYFISVSHWFDASKSALEPRLHELVESVKQLLEYPGSLPAVERLREHEAAASVPDLNPFLSEFLQWPGFARWLNQSDAGAAIWWIFAGWASLVVFLAWLSGTACMQAVIGTSPEITIYFGYLAEFNHGIFYLLIAPYFARQGLDLVRDADRGLREIGGRFVLLSPGGTVRYQHPFREISRQNRRLFRICLPVSVFLGLLLAVGLEVPSFNDTVLGWVQSAQMQLHGRLKAGMPVRELAEPIVGLKRSLGQQRYDALHFTRVSELPRGWRATTFYLFLTFALAMETAFIAFGFWLSFKILYVFGIFAKSFKCSRPDQDFGSKSLKNELEHCRPSGPNDTYQFRLNCLDKQFHRFGVSSLDEVYRDATRLVLIAAVVVLTGFLSNVAKGTTFYNGFNFAYAGQFAQLLTAMLIFLQIAVRPARQFRRWTLEVQHVVCVALENRRRDVSGPNSGGEEDQADQDRIDADLQVVRNQTPWPRNDLIFQRLVIAIVTCGAAFLVLVPMVPQVLIATCAGLGVIQKILTQWLGSGRWQ